jgi:tryptophan 2,3-dioxygenase
MDTKKTTKSRVEAGMHIDLAGRRTYSEYLKLDRLFAAQQPVSQEHDEVAFIIIHHVQELWLKLVAHEVEAAMTSIRADNLPPAFKSLARVTRIQEQLITAWDVLSTMTPADYLAFRSTLGAGIRVPILPVPSGRVPAGRQGPRDATAASPRSYRPCQTYGSAQRAQLIR